MRNQEQIQHTSVYLPKGIHTALRVASLNQGRTMSELIAKALDGAWNLHEEPPLAPYGEGKP